MAAPPGYAVRSATAADIPAVASLLSAHDLAFLGEDWYTADDVRDDWARMHLDVARDVRMIVSAAGSIDAYVWCWTRDPGELAVVVGVVHPDRRGLGLGAALVELSEAWARARVADAGRALVVHNVVVEQDVEGAALLAARGYRLERHFFQMERALDGTEQPGLAPPGIVVRPFSFEPDAHAVHALLDEAFAEHWLSRSFTFEEWVAVFVDRPTYEPALWFVASDERGPVGALLGRGQPAYGWVNTLGVLKRARSRGVGTALLRHAFAAFAAHGLRKVGLNVDAGNETGATALYEKVGMRAAVQMDYWEKTFEPG